MSDRLVVGTRGSELALWQARWIQRELGGERAGVELEIIRTQGDRRLDVSLAAGSLDKGAFTKELEQALLDGRVDVAVHSLKDLPTEVPEGLALGAPPRRAPVGDVLLVRPDSLDPDAPALPIREGATVGTGSPRRVALLHHVRPDAVVPEVFRGNVPTRIRKCVDGEVDALVLARAGVSRLGLDVAPLHAFDLQPERWLPAPAQGALGLEIRAGDETIRQRLAPLAHRATGVAVAVERGLLAHLEAGCHAALGTWARAPEAAAPGAELIFDAGLLDAHGTWRATRLRAEPAALVGLAADALGTDAQAGGAPGEDGGGSPSPEETTSPWALPAAPWGR